MPIICQCKWPFRSYTGNKLSTGTHHWSRRRMISLRSQSPICTAFFNPGQYMPFYCKSWTHLPRQCQFTEQCQCQCQCYTKLPIHYQSTNQCTYPLNPSNPLILDHPANSPTQCQSKAYLTLLVRQPLHNQSNPNRLHKLGLIMNWHQLAVHWQMSCQSMMNPSHKAQFT